MEIDRITVNVPKIIEFINKTDLTPDEKIAVLRSAADTINQVLSAEGLVTMYKNLLNKMF